MSENQVETERAKFNAAAAVKKILAPDVESRRSVREGINNYAYVAIICIISLISIVVPPLINGCLSGDISLAFPHTVEGWILWVLLNGGMAVCNISLLILFNLQARKNSMKNENYIKANEILNKLAGKKDVFIPRSPAKMRLQVYSKKVIMILLSTLASSVVLTSIVVSFDWLTLLSCILSVLISLCVSWISMLNMEQYWTEEYLIYAQLKLKELSEDKEC